MLDQQNLRILIVAAHPDDEILGCGATINKLIKEQGATVHATVLSRGITSRGSDAGTEKQIKEHLKCLENSVKAIGIQSMSTHDLPDNKFDELPLLDIVKVVESEIKTFNPDVIFTHFQQDLNVDHRKSFEAVITACRPTGAHGVKGIYSFEIPSSTGWSVGDSVLYNPNTFVSVSEENLKAKISALECYKFETRDFPHPRSAKGLHVYSQFRGMQCNRDHAEAFIQAKTIY